MATIYILKSIKSGQYYVGSTILTKEERLKKHNRGYVRSTKANRPWNIVYFENYNSLSEARNREFQIKLWKKRKAIEKLISAPIV